MGKALKYFEENGQIDNISHCKACDFNCCKTDDDNYIVLFPWEKDEALREGLKIDHLKPINNNPNSVHCVSPCTGDDDYKPVNCAAYPVYPISEDLDNWVRGSERRCPITNARLAKQIDVVKNGLRKIEKVHKGSIKTLVDFIKDYPGALESFKQQ